MGKEGLRDRAAAVVILILASVLFSYSVLLYQYTTLRDGIGAEDWTGIPIPANQTFSFDFIMDYALTSDTGWGSMDRNTSTHIYKEPLPIQTAASWASDDFSFRFLNNASKVIHVTIYANIVPITTATSLDPGRNFDVHPGDEREPRIPIIPKEEGRVTFSILVDPVQSDQPYVGRIYIRWNRTWLEKPFYNHGIAGLLISTVCPILLLVQHITTLRRGERYESS